MGICLILYKNVSLRMVTHAIWNAKPAWLALVFAAATAIPVILGMRLSVMARMPALRMSRCMFKVFFLNNWAPAQIGGDLYKVIALYGHIGNHGRALSAVVCDRLVGLIAHVVLVVMSLILGWRHFEQSIYAQGAMAYVVLVCAAVAVVVAGPIGWLGRVPVVRAIAPKVRRSQDQLRATMRESLCYGVTLTIGVVAVYEVMLCAAMAALELPVDVYSVVVFFPVISVLVLTLPVSFNGLGVRESLFVLFFGMVGYTREEGLAIGVIYLMAVLMLSVIGGLLFLVEGTELSSVGNAEFGRGKGALGADNTSSAEMDEVCK